jgi:hypothetical protein
MLAGDQVKWKRRLRKSLIGVVTHVYDPQRASLPNGGNDYGFTIRVDGTYYWFGGQPGFAIEILDEGGVNDEEKLPTKKGFPEP